MKTSLLVVVLTVCMAIGGHAAEHAAAAKAKGKGKAKPQTKEEFVAQRKAAAEKTGKQFDQAKVEAQFDKLDKNQDGLLTPDEMPQKKGKAKAKGKKKAKPAAEAAGE